MFGIPQNRPRVYIIAFSREYFGEEADSLPNSTPKKGRKTIYSSLFDVLEKGEVDDSYFLSSGYLETLEKHIVRQREKGYGFGYRVVNSPEIENPIANTLLATGGSGRERNLILDRENGLIYAGKMVKRKYSPINNKYIRTMTPNEWGKLQGFIGYAFVEKDGIDRFSFPPEVSNLQKYKQFGNSVTIPVIEEMAKFILECIDSMTKDYTAIQKRLFAMYGNEHKVCSAIYQKLGSSLREKTINIYFDIVFYFKCDSKFRNIEVAEFLGISSARASQIITQLCSVHCLSRNADRTYSFTIT